MLDKSVESWLAISIVHVPKKFQNVLNVSSHTVGVVILF